MFPNSFISQLFHCGRIDHCGTDSSHQTDTLQKLYDGYPPHRADTVSYRVTHVVNTISRPGRKRPDRSRGRCTKTCSHPAAMVQTLSEAGTPASSHASPPLHPELTPRLAAAHIPVPFPHECYILHVSTFMHMGWKTSCWPSNDFQRSRARRRMWACCIRGPRVLGRPVRLDLHAGGCGRSKNFDRAWASTTLHARGWSLRRRSVWEGGHGGQALASFFSARAWMGAGFCLHGT